MFDILFCSVWCSVLQYWHVVNVVCKAMLYKDVYGFKVICMIFVVC